MRRPTNPLEPRITRRRSLVTLGGLVAAALGAGGWRAASSEAASAGAGPVRVASGDVTCVLAPEQTEGPYYVADEELRRDITEEKAGSPLTLRLRVVDASTCKPIRGAVVDVWHCDAGGAYSGVDSDSSFLRGIQRTNANGVATFRTIYPGWYRGRTVHVHVKVHLGGDVLHTGQLYFPDALTDVVYRQAPYSRRPSREVRNATDPIFRNGGKGSTLRLRRSGAGHVGRITMGVQAV